MPGHAEPTIYDVTPGGGGWRLRRFLELSNLATKHSPSSSFSGNRATAMLGHGASLWAASSGGQADLMGSTVKPSSRSIGQPDNRAVLAGRSRR
jgi:hypothetical protein